MPSESNRSAPAPRSRDDDDTAEFLLTGPEPLKVVHLPPRDRGSLVMLTGPSPGAVHPIGDGELVIGRGTQVGLTVDDRSLSRQHARVFRRDDGFVIQDLDSTNGSFVNGEQVRGQRRLRDGDRVQIGMGTAFRFVLHDEQEQQTARDLYESAVRDPLTGLYNRRHLDERLASEFSFARRHGTPLTAMLVDVDHFKAVNDTWGHAAGDAVLRVVGKALPRILRNEDFVARYGGEEFCVLARAVDRRNGLIVAERCRRSIRGLALPWESTHLSVTVSIGIATHGPETSYSTVEALLDAADRALYRAKETGRDRVCEP